MDGHSVATIPAEEAHIWFDHERRLLAVVRFQPGHNPLGRFACDTGASEKRWRDASPVERQRELYELAIEFMVAGHDPKHVVREFAKIREFAATGGQSYTMARALTEAIEGRAYECPVTFAERYLP